MYPAAAAPADKTLLNPEATASVVASLAADATFLTAPVAAFATPLTVSVVEVTADATVDVTVDAIF